MEGRRAAGGNCALRSHWCSLSSSASAGAAPCRAVREAPLRYLPDLETLQAFLAVAEELSFRKAAERMNIDHSAISRRIKDLELRLGFDLFYRTTREVQLTEAGRVLYRENRVLLAALRSSIEAARRTSAGRSGRIRVGYMAFAALARMPRAVAAFSRRYPDVSVEIIYMGTQALKMALARGALDAAFLIGPFEHHDFHTLCVDRERLVAVLPASHALAAAPDVSLPALARSPLILGSLEMWSFYRMLIDEMFGARGLAAEPLFEPSSTLGILGLVAAGLGVSLLPESFRQIGMAEVVFRPLADCPTGVETLLVWPRTAASAVLHFIATCPQGLEE